MCNIRAMAGLYLKSTASESEVDSVQQQNNNTTSKRIGSTFWHLLNWMIEHAPRYNICDIILIDWNVRFKNMRSWSKNITSTQKLRLYSLSQRGCTLTWDQLCRAVYTICRRTIWRSWWFWICGKIQND